MDELDAENVHPDWYKESVLAIERILYNNSTILRFDAGSTSMPISGDRLTRVRNS